MTDSVDPHSISNAAVRERDASLAAHEVRASGPSYVRGLTLLGAVALVVGNMVGTSIYTLPASLAKDVGPLGLVAWLVAAVGFFFVALVYASLGRRYPKTGGPYVFVRQAFGEFAGFQTVWAYWISATTGNAAIATGAVAYIAGFSNELAASRGLQFALAQALLWSLCCVNVLGVRYGARLQIAIMFFNVVPLILLSLVALLHFDAKNLVPFAPMTWKALPIGVALVVWAYSGIESATVPAEEVQGHGRTIRHGTLIGYALGTLVFLLVALASTGALPNSLLASESARPMALVAEAVVGHTGAIVIGLAAILAAIGTLNGWILMAGRIPVTAAEDGIFFERFARIHPRFGTPHVALILGTAVASATCVLYFSDSLLGVFNFIVLLAVLTTLLPHLYACAAELMLARSDPERYSKRDRRRAHVVAPIAFVFLLFTIYGVGAQPVLWGFLAVLAGTPLYIVFKTRRR